MNAHPSRADVLGDVRYTIRTLRRSPTLAIGAVASLVIGLALNATVFAITNAVRFTGFASVRGNGEILYIGTQKDGMVRASHRLFLHAHRGFFNSRLHP